jgi:hypothetical protein
MSVTSGHSRRAAMLASTSPLDSMPLSSPAIDAGFIVARPVRSDLCKPAGHAQ